MTLSRFDWDGGNWTKCQRHGVSIEEIEDLFAGPVQVSPDQAHSIAEQRFQGFGRNAAGRAILVIFTLRKRDTNWLIRPVSARYMHRKEAAFYEKEAPDPDDGRRG